MAAYTLQIECLSCSNRRHFLWHGDAAQRTLTQAEAIALPKNEYLTCGRCGSSSLIRGWADATPDATIGYIGRRRRKRSAKAALASAAE